MVTTLIATSEAQFELFILRKEAKPTVFNQVILDQALETSCIGKTLRDQEPDCDRELIFLRRNPAVDILKECWECRLFKGFLKIFVSNRERSGAVIEKWREK